MLFRSILDKRVDCSGRRFYRVGRSSRILFVSIQVGIAVISNLVFLGVLLILGGAGQLLFRHKWADSVLGITSDSRLN